MAELVIEKLADDTCPVRALPRDLAERWPDAAILDVVVAIATGANAVEAMFTPKGPCTARALTAWRVAALVATDLRAMQALGLDHARAADLLAYWRAHDPYFLQDDPS